MSTQETCVIRVFESRDGAVHDGNACVLGQHARIDKALLPAFLWSQLQAVDADLLNLLASVRFGDRLLARKLSRAWGRELRVLMPVDDPSRWSSPSVIDALSSCLQCLTGDRWHFEFRGRRAADPLMVQYHLLGPLGRGGVVMPYSGGLDSYTALELHLNGSSGPRPTLLTAGINPQVVSLLKATAGSEKCHRVVLPVGSSKVEHGESSGRPRTFVFFAMAALAARMAEAEAVVIPENGQGTLGPALVPFGREHPLMTSHPRFTRLLRSFLAALWGEKPPAFCHPWVFSTKGQMLSAAATAGRAQGWSRTVSCGRTTARAKGKGAPHHCGVCANCLLRRQSLHVAGLSDFANPVEPYLWSLDAPSLDSALVAGMRQVTERDRGYAVNGVMNLQALASLDADHPGPALLRKVEDIAWGLDIPIEQAQEGVAGLVATHKREWDQCLDSLPAGSWLRHMAMGGA